MKKVSIPELRLKPDTLNDWTVWLQEHHQTDVVAFVRVRKTKSRKPGIYLAQAVPEALRFGWVDGRVNTIDEDYFWLRFTPRGPKSVWSLINRQRVEAMIINGTLTPLGLKTVEWGKANGTWQAAYTSYDKTPIPKELQQALDQDENARNHFESWPNSDKLQVIYWINTAKKEETRSLRIDEIIALVKSGGKLSELSKKSTSTE